MERTLGSLAATGLILSIIVHGLTFFPGGTPITEKHPIFWALHIGMFVVFVPFVLAAQRLSRHFSILAFWRILPWWGIALDIAAIVYAYVNFASFFELTQIGRPEIRDGQFVLLSKGQIVRTLTQEEYDVMRGYVARGFSGHWMLFYLTPMLYFLFRLTPAPPPGASPPPSPSGTKE